eukprot:5875609-Heterocapsa_arctica.AAC.1
MGQASSFYAAPPPRPRMQVPPDSMGHALQAPPRRWGSAVANLDQTPVFSPATSPNRSMSPV